jgi:hypothetical protein
MYVVYYNKIGATHRHYPAGGPRDEEWHDVLPHRAIAQKSIQFWKFWERDRAVCE